MERIVVANSLRFAARISLRWDIMGDCYSPQTGAEFGDMNVSWDSDFGFNIGVD